MTNPTDVERIVLVVDQRGDPIRLMDGLLEAHLGRKSPGTVEERPPLLPIQAVV